MSPSAEPEWRRAERAEAMLVAGSSEEAWKMLDGLVADHPDYGAARKLLARSLRELGRADEAVVHLQAVLERTPADQAALKALGDLLLHRGELRGARTIFEHLAELRPDDEFLRDMLDEMAPVSPIIPAGASDTRHWVEEGRRAIVEVRASMLDGSSLERDVLAAGPHVPRQPAASELSEGLKEVVSSEGERSRALLSSRRVEETEEVADERLPREPTPPPSTRASTKASKSVVRRVESSPPIAPPASAETGDVGGPLIETVTIADIFVEQGLYGPAMQIYKKIALRRPDDVEIGERIRGLEARMAAPATESGAPPRISTESSPEN